MDNQTTSPYEYYIKFCECKKRGTSGANRDDILDATMSTSAALSDRRDFAKSAYGQEALQHHGSEDRSRIHDSEMSFAHDQLCVGRFDRDKQSLFRCRFL